MIQTGQWRGIAAASAGVALALTACTSQARSGDNTPIATAAPAPARHPVSGLAVIDLTIVPGAHRGRPHRFLVEVAASPAEQEQGLMFRTAMAPDEGMIFPMTNRQPASFWMKNTVLPLDIVFIGLDGRISNIAANARPYDETPLSSIGPVRGVLELNGGRAAQLGIAPGDRVDW